MPDRSPSGLSIDLIWFEEEKDPTRSWFTTLYTQFPSFIVPFSILYAFLLCYNPGYTTLCLYNTPILQQAVYLIYIYIYMCFYRSIHRFDLLSPWLRATDIWVWSIAGVTKHKDTCVHTMFNMSINIRGHIYIHIGKEFRYFLPGVLHISSQIRNKSDVLKGRDTRRVLSGSTI